MKLKLLIITFALICSPAWAASNQMTLVFQPQVTGRLGALTMGDLIQKDKTSSQITQRFSGVSLEGVQGGTLQVSQVLELLRHEGLDLDQVKVEPPMQIQVTLTEPKDLGATASIQIEDVQKMKKVVPALVARRSLAAGEQITAEDFQEEMRDATLSESQGFTAGASQLKGKKITLVHDVTEGNTLKNDDFESSLNPKKGDMVTIMIENKDFQIRALGRVKDVQDNGARVLVENTDSKKEIWGQAISQSEVKVVF